MATDRTHPDFESPISSTQILGVEVIDSSGVDEKDENWSARII